MSGAFSDTSRATQKDTTPDVTDKINIIKLLFIMIAPDAQHTECTEKGKRRENHHQTLFAIAPKGVRPPDDDYIPETYLYTRETVKGTARDG